NRVLAVDFDSQGNMTQFLTQRNIYDFTSKTVLQAVQEKDPRPYIYPINDYLHILPSEDFLSGFPLWLHRQYKGGDYRTVLRETLDVVKEKYDYIIIDLPPNLGDHTTNGLAACDYAVVMLQSEPFCYDAVDRYLEFLMAIKNELNPDLILAGVLPTMLDTRASLDNNIIEKAKEEYEGMVFETTIKRRSKIKEYTITGIQHHTKADKEALEHYYHFVEELMLRVQRK
ncbi:MAG: ParA family protein, partial [Heyndrickxia sp.]